MRRFSDDESGQLILIACVSIAAVIVLIAAYGYYTIATGENSINREIENSYYYYYGIRGNYINISKFENELKGFALLHGYSLGFVCNNNNATIIFTDRDMRIEEDLKGSC